MDKLSLSRIQYNKQIESLTPSDCPLPRPDKKWASRYAAAAAYARGNLISRERERRRVMYTYIVKI